MPTPKPRRPASARMPLEPRAGDEALDPALRGESLLARIQLLCDGTRGVLIFRAKGRFYLRIVSPSS